MANRRRNPRLAKSLHNYSIAGIAELYDVHRQTVRHWLANGLKPIDDRRPILIHGTELNRFHAQRRASHKQRCGPGELYCLGCRGPRVPAANMADFVPLSKDIGTVSALCSECGRVMTQRVNAQRLASFKATFDVMIRPVLEPIGKSP